MDGRKLTQAEAENFAKNMAAFQAAENLTNKDLGDFLKVSANYISQLRSGKAKPSERIIAAVSDLTGTKAEDLAKSPEERQAKEMKAYGHKVRNARHEKGFSQNEMSDYLHTTKMVYAEIEAGQFMPAGSMKEKLEKILDLKTAKMPAELDAPSTQTLKTESRTDGDLYEAIDVVLSHVTDLKVSKEVQRKIFRTFSEYQTQKREEALFGGKEV